MTVSPFVLSGKTTVSQLAGILLNANLFVSNDSGPMHMANALNIPVVAIFGPTESLRTGPYQQPSAIVKINKDEDKEREMDCWPCRHRECPTDHKCMAGISAMEVYRACERFLP